jgi:hypothetical protein
MHSTSAYSSCSSEGRRLIYNCKEQMEFAAQYPGLIPKNEASKGTATDPSPKKLAWVTTEIYDSRAISQ